MKTCGIAGLALPLALAASPLCRKEPDGALFRWRRFRRLDVFADFASGLDVSGSYFRVKELPAGSAAEKAHPDYERPLSGGGQTRYGYCTIAPKGKNVEKTAPP